MGKTCQFNLDMQDFRSRRCLKSHSFWFYFSFIFHFRKSLYACEYEEKPVSQFFPVLSPHSDIFSHYNIDISFTLENGKKACLRDRNGWGRGTQEHKVKFFFSYFLNLPFIPSQNNSVKTDIPINSPIVDHFYSFELKYNCLNGLSSIWCDGSRRTEIDI